MDKQAFLKFCSGVFKTNGFERKGNAYYYDNLNGILLVFGLQKSSYGPYYYLEYGLAFKRINKHLPYPHYYELDMNLGRIMTPFGKALRYESMQEAECTVFAMSIQSKIDELRPIIDGGKEQIVDQLVFPEPNNISYLLKGCAEFLGVSNEHFKKHRIAIVDD